ncbi:MAG TPA: spore photoproduct lyase, partial [Clostridiales bacterium]|nr:spore photoproduct lyase [Clostridiales bacterium]
MFRPRRILFEKDALNYEMAQNIFRRFQDDKDVEIIQLDSNRIQSHIPGSDLFSRYREGKKTLVVGVKKSLNFQSCKPSAHYQLPLVSGCMGQCEYCYLNTRLGDRPFVKVHVNVEDILNQARKYIDARLPDLTIFEGSATSDPVPVEPYTGSLQRAVEFFGEIENARFRFVTKYTDIDTLLDIAHHGHTEIRFSLNTPSVINAY